jgi:hypothetical protein
MDRNKNNKNFEKIVPEVTEISPKGRLGYLKESFLRKARITAFCRFGFGYSVDCRR